MKFNDAFFLWINMSAARIDSYMCHGHFNRGADQLFLSYFSPLDLLSLVHVFMQLQFTSFPRFTSRWVHVLLVIASLMTWSVRPVSQDFVELSEAETAPLSRSIVPWPLSLVCRKGGQGTALDTFRNSRTNAGIPARSFFTRKNFRCKSTPPYLSNSSLFFSGLWPKHNINPSLFCVMNWPGVYS